MRVTFLAGGLLAVALTLAACGGTTDTPVDVGGGAAAGACLEGTTDCDDTPAEGETPVEEESLAEGELASDDQPAGDMYDSRTAIMRAEALLGLSEGELDLDDPIDTRIGRRGEEQIALARDYQLGRMTVELDIDDTDEWIVAAVTVVLPDGPETFTRHLP